MHIALRNIHFDGLEPELASVDTGCIVVGIYDKDCLTEQAAALDGAGAISTVLRSGDLAAQGGSGVLLYRPHGTRAQRVLLLGLGKRGELSGKIFSDSVRSALSVIATISADEVVLALPFGDVEGRDVGWAVQQTAQMAQASQHRSDTLKTQRDNASSGPDRIVLASPVDEPAQRALEQGVASAKGVMLARELSDLPPNICTPAYLADRARILARDYNFAIEVLLADALRELKMDSYLAVAGGSELPPAMIVLRHMGATADGPPLVLVGKGLTFDSGGISIKPGAAMDEMKYDMCGAAAVLGAFLAIGELGLPLNVIGVIAACENMPSGRATRPGDIVNTMNGLTVEVLNTDAEGRLVLCDALTYVERFKPAAVVDIATLTGACVVALGSHNSGLFSRSTPVDNALASELFEAGLYTGDLAWRMPLDAAYGDQLKSNFADLANIGAPGGGAVVAAAFLERFTRNYPWAHLDIAGTAWKSGADKGATGRPVPLLVNFLCSRAAQDSGRSM